jgi:hypothetical protein
MKKILITDDDYEFLKDLQHELKTQTNDGNADPVYWGVMETKEYAAPSGCGEEKIHLGDGMVVDLKEAVRHVREYLPDYQKKVGKFWEEEVDKDDIEEVADFIRNMMEMQADIVEVEERSFISRETGAFLTKRACQEYITRCGYNHSRPHTYAMTAYRNHELGRLLKILKTMEIEDTEF